MNIGILGISCLSDFSFLEQHKQQQRDYGVKHGKHSAVFRTFIQLSVLFCRHSRLSVVEQDKTNINTEMNDRV